MCAGEPCARPRVCVCRAIKASAAARGALPLRCRGAMLRRGVGSLSRTLQRAQLSRGGPLLLQQRLEGAAACALIAPGTGGRRLVAPGSGGGGAAVTTMAMMTTSAALGGAGRVLGAIRPSQRTAPPSRPLSIAPQAAKAASSAAAAPKVAGSGKLGKKEIVESLSAYTGLNKSQSQRAFEHIVDFIMESVAKGERVTVVGFGCFEPRSRNARKGRNPQTGEAMDIPPMTLPRFSPGKEFKDKVKLKHNGIAPKKPVKALKTK